MGEPVDATVELAVVASVELAVVASVELAVVASVELAVVASVEECAVDVVAADSTVELVVGDPALVDEVGKTDSVDGPVVEACVVVGKVRLTTVSCDEVELEVATDVVAASVLDVVVSEGVELVSEAVVLSVVETLVAPPVRGLGRP